MEFEYDEDKSKKNKGKHGIFFEEAEALWNDLDLIEIPGRWDASEERVGVIGRIAGRYWTAFITYRDNKVRIISVRYSRKKEREVYEKKKDG